MSTILARDKSFSVMRLYASYANIIFKLETRSVENMQAFGQIIKQLNATGVPTILLQPNSSIEILVELWIRIKNGFSQ